MSETKTKKPFYKKWWFFLIVGIVVIGAIGGQGNKNKSQDSPDSPASANESSAPESDNASQDASAELAPEITVAAPVLAEAFESNEIKANQEYKGKVAEITGEISSIGEALGQTYVVLSAGKDFAVTQVQCFFKDEAEIQKIAEMSKGQTVTIIGKIDGKSMNVSVKDAKFK